MKHSHEGVPETEVLGEVETTERPHLTIEESNAIQMGLVAKYFEKYREEFGDDIEKTAEAWIQAYAEEFHALIDNEPDLVHFFHEDPDRCFALISEKLYTHTIH